VRLETKTKEQKADRTHRMPVAIDSQQKVVNALLCGSRSSLSKTNSRIPNYSHFHYLYLMRPLLDARRSARVGKLLPKKSTPPLARTSQHVQ